MTGMWIGIGVMCGLTAVILYEMVVGSPRRQARKAAKNLDYEYRILCEATANEP